MNIEILRIVKSKKDASSKLQYIKEDGNVLDLQEMMFLEIEKGLVFEQLLRAISKVLEDNGKEAVPENWKKVYVTHRYGETLFDSVRQVADGAWTAKYSVTYIG